MGVNTFVLIWTTQIQSLIYEKVWSCGRNFIRQQTLFVLFNHYHDHATIKYSFDAYGTV